MFGGINDRKYIMEKLNKMARENLGIDYRVTDQSRLKYDSPIKNEKRFADSLEREMFHTERGPRNEKLLNNNGMSGYLDLIKSPMKNANIKTQNQQIQNVPQKQIIDKPKYVSNNVGSPNNASIKNRDQEEPMNDTSYNIAKAKFFGVEPDKTLTLKKKMQKLSLVQIQQQ